MEQDKKKPLNIIFFDVDGVLNDEMWSKYYYVLSKKYPTIVNDLSNEFDPAAIEELNKLGAHISWDKHNTDTMAKTQFVLSSSWRWDTDVWNKLSKYGLNLDNVYFDIKRYNNLFKNLKKKFNGKIPLEETRKIYHECYGTIPRDMFEHGNENLRGEIIKKFIEDFDDDNYYIRNYVILDDDTDMLEEQDEHFVNIDFTFGLSGYNYKEDVCEILDNQDLWEIQK